MVKRIFSVAALWAVSNVVFAADVGLIIHGCVPGKTVRVALFNHAKYFEEGLDGKFASDAMEIMAEQAVVNAVFRNVKPGRYAVAVYVDMNGNRKLDANLIGMPAEPYGFSRDARNTFGPPDFLQAAFEVGETGTVQSIHLK